MEEGGTSGSIQDISLDKRFIKRLSINSGHLSFLGGMGSFSPKWLQGFVYYPLSLAWAPNIRIHGLKEMLISLAQVLALLFVAFRLTGCSRSLELMILDGQHRAESCHPTTSN